MILQAPLGLKLIKQMDSGITVQRENRCEDSGPTGYEPVPSGRRQAIWLSKALIIEPLGISSFLNHFLKKMILVII